MRDPGYTDLLSLRPGPSKPMASEKAQDLHLLRQFDQELLVTFEMMNLRRIAARQLAHRLDTFPIGNRHELGFVLAVRPERLNTQRLAEEWPNANFVGVGFVLIGEMARGSPAPDPDNRVVLLSRSGHYTILF